MWNGFAVPREDRYFEDYLPGSAHELGAITVDPAELVWFAERFDPQPMHMDEAAARQGPFGGLIASGWHTAGLAMRLIVEHYLSCVASRPSPGVDELRWHRPVLPGDRISVRVTVLDARLSASRPGLGIVRSLVEASNGQDQPVMTMRAVNMLSCRPIATTQAAATAVRP